MTVTHSRPVRSLLVGLLIFISFFSVLLAGCGSSPEGSASISFTTYDQDGNETADRQIPADGTSAMTIEALIITTDGEPAPVGTPVRFTTTLGRFKDGSQSYQVLVENTDGTVFVSLIAGYANGVATVTAHSNDTSQSVYIQIGVAGGFIKLEADPNTLPADGTSASRSKPRSPRPAVYQCLRAPWCGFEPLSVTFPMATRSSMFTRWTVPALSRCP